MIVQRFGGVSGWLVAAALVGACGDEVVVKNGQPRVTWVALEALGEDRAALTLWVQDAEGDAVDVVIRWRVGGEEGPVVLAAGSPPLMGLPTELGIGDDAGQAHRVVWNLGEVPPGNAELTLQVDDRPHQGGDGDTYRVDGLDPRVGGGPAAASR